MVSFGWRSRIGGGRDFVLHNQPRAVVRERANRWRGFSHKRITTLEQTMKRTFCVLGLSLCVGCATAVVRPYVGEQQNWPTASGSIVNTRYSLPVFTTLPPAPYDILAEMRIQSPLYAVPEEGHLPVLVKKAKQIG